MNLSNKYMDSTGSILNKQNSCRPYTVRSYEIIADVSDVDVENNSSVVTVNN